MVHIQKTFWRRVRDPKQTGIKRKERAQHRVAPPVSVFLFYLFRHPNPENKKKSIIEFCAHEMYCK